MAAVACRARLAPEGVRGAERWTGAPPLPKEPAQGLNSSNPEADPGHPLSTHGGSLPTNEGRE